MAILYDPFTKETIHDDQLFSPIVNSDENGDYIIHRENGKTSYKAYEGGGSELPEVTADDNGDVLTVVSGEWAKATPSGGGVLIVLEDGDTGELNKTWQEIHDADVAFIATVVGTSYKSFANVIEINEQSGTYSVTSCAPFNNQGEAGFSIAVYTASSASGYPMAQ